MVYEDLGSLIANLGFPIAITIYLLITRDKVIDRNSEAIDNLSATIQGFLKK